MSKSRVIKYAHWHAYSITHTHILLTSELILGIALLLLDVMYNVTCRLKWGVVFCCCFVLFFGVFFVYVFFFFFFLFFFMNKLILWPNTEMFSNLWSRRKMEKLKPAGCFNSSRNLKIEIIMSWISLWWWMDAKKKNHLYTGPKRRFLVPSWVIFRFFVFVQYLSRIVTKPIKWSVRSANTQISLGISPFWPVSSLSAGRKLWSLATH